MDDSHDPANLRNELRQRILDLKSGFLDVVEAQLEQQEKIAKESNLRSENQLTQLKEKFNDLLMRAKHNESIYKERIAKLESDLARRIEAHKGDRASLIEANRQALLDLRNVNTALEKRISALEGQLQKSEQALNTAKNEAQKQLEQVKLNQAKTLEKNAADASAKISVMHQEIQNHKNAFAKYQVGTENLHRQKDQKIEELQGQVQGLHEQMNERARSLGSAQDRLEKENRELRASLQQQRVTFTREKAELEVNLSKAENSIHDLQHELRFLKGRAQIGSRSQEAGGVPNSGTKIESELELLSSLKQKLDSQLAKSASLRSEIMTGINQSNDVAPSAEAQDLPQSI